MEVYIVHTNLGMGVAGHSDDFAVAQQCLQLLVNHLSIGYSEI